MYQTVTSFVLNLYFYHSRRSMRTSASVDADVCVGRYEHLRLSMRTSASVDADNKSGCIKAVWVYKNVQQKLLKLRLRGYGRDAIPS